MTATRRPPADQKIREAASRRLRDSFLLEAGAGTGKTTVLLDRVEEILKTEIPLERIAVITFTEKAAGELKLRLRRRMEEMVVRIGAESGWGVHLRRSLESLDRATVGTIHSFAASLLRERPVEAGVDPRFSVADGLAAAMLLEETWDRWIERQMAEGAGPLRRALRLGITLAQLRRLATGIVAHRDIEPAAGPAATGALPLSAARDGLVDGIGALVELSASCVTPADGALRHIGELASKIAALRAADEDRLLSLLLELPLNGKAGAQSAWRPPEHLARVKEIIAGLGRLRDEVVRPAKGRLMAELAAWIRDGYLHAYRMAKEARRLLDFEDLLIICRNMLRESGSARLAFQNRFDCLLVDEFQDTDPLQTEILFLLAADDPSVTDWRRARPRPGKLFVVGDPKQSIYRFRRADVTLYHEVKELLRSTGGITNDRLREEGTGGRGGLTQNFRTVPAIVSWVNQVFSTLMEPAGTAGQPLYEGIEAYRTQPLAPQAGVLILAPRGSGNPAARADDVRLAEARQVASLVRTALAAGWPVADRETGEIRPIRHGDVALLFRASTALEIYEDVLRDHGIPYRIAGGKRYYRRAEIRALQAVLWAIECAHDPLAVVSALRSPFFGFSDEDLLTHGMPPASPASAWAYTSEGAGRGTPFDKAFDLLRRLHAARNVRPVAATLEALYEGTGALSLFYLKPDGDQRAANLLKAIDLARAHEAAGGATFGSFSRWLEGMDTDEREEGEAPLTEEQETLEDEPGAIRILTVHKAKGLEFPMVVLCDTSGRTRQELPACLIERSGGTPAMELAAGSGAARLESPGYAAAAERETEHLRAEEIRLFYVAATRARDYLVIPVTGGAAAGGQQGWLAQAGFLDPRPDGTYRGGALRYDTAAPGDAAGTAAPFRLETGEAVPVDPAWIAEKAAWRTTLDLALKAPPMGREFRTPAGLETPVAAPSTGAGPDDAARRRSRCLGTAVHRVLERIDLTTRRHVDLLSEEAADHVGHPALAVEVRKLVMTALDAPIVGEALASPLMFRELPFVVAGDAWICEGRADLVFESGGGLTVVDFKTDHATTDAEIAARAEGYLPQALVYAWGIQQAAGRPVTRVVLHFLRAGVERAWKVDEELLARGRRLLETGSARTGA